MDRSERTKVFIRICSDSGFRIDATQASQLTAILAQCHPLDIMGDIGFDNMQRIASGTHPAVKKTNLEGRL